MNSQWSLLCLPNKVVLIFPLTEEEQYEDIERSSTRSRAAQNEATFANEWNPNNIPDIPGQTSNRIGDVLRNELYPTTHELVRANLIRN